MPFSRPGHVSSHLPPRTQVNLRSALSMVAWVQQSASRIEMALATKHRHLHRQPAFFLMHTRSTVVRPLYKTPFNGARII